MVLPICHRVTYWRNCAPVTAAAAAATPPGAEVGHLHRDRERAAGGQAELVAGEVEARHIGSADDRVQRVSARIAHPGDWCARRLIGQPFDGLAGKDGP